MYYFCTNCHEVYDHNLEQISASKYGNNYNIRTCPKTGCHGATVEIDELIMPAILEFNRKGYITEYCCSGHPYDENPSPYVSFTRFYHFPAENAPSTWQQSVEWGTLHARPIKEGATVKEKIEYITKACTDLYEYARKLENFKNL